MILEINTNNTQPNIERGITLVELSLAMALLGMIALLSWPSLRGYSSRLSTRAKAYQWVERLRSAREKAVISGAPQNVSSEESEEVPQTVVFYPDGSASSAQIDFKSVDGTNYQVLVEENGQVCVHES